MSQYLELLKLILPEYLVEYFDLVSSQKEDEVMHLYFEERNIVPIKDSKRIIIAHGFHKSITIQDFPLRGNTVYLHIKRRRWLDKNSQEIIQRDWDLVAQGTRMTSEFAAFLKEISRY
ncbi:ISAon1 family transposase N-terminal region protein [Sphingobacterium rhinopitheci]|uniref:ISAon1 family transposase N-terminal region protein n=1 Tax=Sphingobacterium rhinopitheci TaxID=2781960 RepID=UPI001F51BEC6|nr:hypothetical protein [Sphingobacterium rhinopitheci]MCI0921419.1 transposase [Sphingobacterium rhinopitheci]